MVRQSGSFITIEGIEGAGKTTQLQLLAERWRRGGARVIETREPGGSGDRLGAALRDLLKDPDVWRELRTAEIYLYAAARAHHLESLILPSLAAGSHVLCDRYLDSTRAYQGFGRGRPLELIESLHRLAPLDRQPDRTLLLDLPVEAGLQRAAERAATEGAGYDEESREFFTRVREGFLAIAAREPERVRVIDAAQSVEQVQRQIVEAIADLEPGEAGE